MITYKNTSRGILKDGHTMFAEDIAKELNRKAHLEEIIKPRDGDEQLVNELAELLRKKNGESRFINTDLAEYLVKAGYRKVI